MLEIGQRVPAATVWTAPRETPEVPDLVTDRPALLLFYLFDWSST
jgi:hypothetical protein